MPNWCSVGFEVCGAEELTRFRELVAGDDDGDPTAFDFNKLIPMPPQLWSLTDDGGFAYTIYYGDAAERMLELPWVKEANITTVEQLRDHLDTKNPDLRATAERWKANLEKYGAGGWYDWSIEYWGTKWNAHYPAVINTEDSLHVEFDAAWSFPQPVMEKLVAEFPLLSFAGSAFEPGVGFALTFEGSDGVFSWEDRSDEYFPDEDEDDEDESSDLPVAEAI